VLNSVLPTGAGDKYKIERVAIYPSEYGLKRMAEVCVWGGVGGIGLLCVLSLCG